MKTCSSALVADRKFGEQTLCLLFVIYGLFSIVVPTFNCEENDPLVTALEHFI